MKNSKGGNRILQCDSQYDECFPRFFLRRFLDMMAAGRWPLASSTQRRQRDSAMNQAASLADAAYQAVVCFY